MKEFSNKSMVEYIKALEQRIINLEAPSGNDFFEATQLNRLHVEIEKLKHEVSEQDSKLYDLYMTIENIINKLEEINE